MKKEFKAIADIIPKNISVLDVGCGDGSLMNLLIKEKNIKARGLEIKEEYVKKCISRGLSVIEGDAETELHQFPDKSFDFVVKTPPAAVLIRKALNITKGSGEPNREKVGKLTRTQLEDIAKAKEPDLNANDIDAAVKIIAGTARSMGVETDL